MSSTPNPEIDRADNSADPNAPPPDDGDWRKTLIRSVERMIRWSLENPRRTIRLCLVILAIGLAWGLAHL